MSESHDVRARMSVNRIIRDEQVTESFLHHEVNQQAPELREDAQDAVASRKTSRQVDPLQEAAQALLSLAQSPRTEDKVPKVEAAAEVRTQSRSSTIDPSSMRSPSNKDIHAQSPSLQIGLPTTTHLAMERDQVQARSNSIELPATNFPSMNGFLDQAQEHPMYHSTRSFAAINHAPGQVHSYYIGTQPKNLSSTSHTPTPVTHPPGVLLATLERLSNGDRKGKLNKISQKPPKTKRPSLKNEVDAGNPDTREFDCTYGDPCMLGQYTLELSRKMVSDYFGRNKKATAMIDGKWIVSCRKHYQRLSYQESWPSMKANIVRSQLVEIEQIEPGMAWQIKLKNSEERRLTQYLHVCAQRGAAPDWTSLAATFIPDDKKQSSLAVLHALSAFCGPAKTKKDCDAIIAEAAAALHSGRATHFPLFEMIPQFSSLGKRKRSGSPASGNEKPIKEKGRPRKSKSSDEEDNFVEIEDHEDDSEDEDFVMEDGESDSEGP